MYEAMKLSKAFFKRRNVLLTNIEIGLRQMETAELDAKRGQLEDLKGVNWKIFYRIILKIKWTDEAGDEKVVEHKRERRSIWCTQKKNRAKLEGHTTH